MCRLMIAAAALWVAGLANASDLSLDIWHTADNRTQAFVLSLARRAFDAHVLYRRWSKRRSRFPLYSRNVQVSSSVPAVELFRLEVVRFVEKR